MLYDKDKPFKILSIDGGGIRGIYPAKFLSELEYQLKQEGKQITQLNKYFDLICGTSTGGIIAMGLALGMPSKDILNLYKNNAKNIFGKKNGYLKSLIKPFHKTTYLEKLLKEEFSKFSDGVTRLGHAKTRVCIPVYNTSKGRVSVYKTSHHPELKIDYQYPAHHVALSTSAAPFYFKPHSFSYKKVHNNEMEEVTNTIDGGIFANNPTLIGIMEAIEALEVPIENLKILSIGTGNKAFSETNTNKKWGAHYWGAPPAPKIFDLMMSAQSDYVNNLVKFLNKGIGNNNSSQFFYERIQFDFDKIPSIDLDETKSEKLNLLINQAFDDFQVKGSIVIEEFFNTHITPFEPVYKL